MRLLKSFFVDNLLLKLLALAIAISLVMSKRDERVVSVKKMVALELKYPEDRLLITVLPPQIELHLEGPYREISRFESETEDSPFKPYKISFDGSENGVYNFQRDYYALPPGLRLKSISPSSMVVKFDERTERKVPVKAAFSGKLSQGYRLEGHTVSPDFVTVVGPKTVLEQLDKIETVSVDLSGRMQTGVLEIALRDPPLFASFTIDSPRVNLRMNVKEIVGERTFENIPLNVVGTPPEKGVKITPSIVTVTLKGPLGVLDGLRASQMRPFVDISKLNNKEVQVVEVQMKPVSRVDKWAVNPNKVSLVFSKEVVPDADVKTVKMNGKERPLETENTTEKTPNLKREATTKNRVKRRQ